MLFHLLEPLAAHVRVLNVVHYITFRTAVASMTAFTISLLCGPWLIRVLRQKQIGQVVRTDGPETHKSKAGTPTMGGVLILGAVFTATLLWANLTDPFVWIAVLSTAGFGAIGFMDDYLKVARKNTYGLFARYKMAGQLAIGALVGVAVIVLADRTPQLYNTHLLFPFFKNWIPDIGLAYILFTMLVLTAASNTVNLTDGLDGLAISTFAVAAATFTAFTYVTGHARFAEYLQLVKMPVGELTIFCGSLVGASLGFLWWNAHPADVFMGDVGSLALGGALGTVAVLIKQELLLPIVGGVFVLEGLSVIIQVASFKTRGKRVFRMAPLHHHFEKIGWAEPKVIARFQILAIIFALFSLLTLKLR